MNQQQVNDRVAQAIGLATIRAIIAEARADEAEAKLAELVEQPTASTPRPRI